MNIELIILASALAFAIVAISGCIIATTIAKIRAMGQVAAELERNMPLPSAKFAERVSRDHEEIRRQRLERGEKA